MEKYFELVNKAAINYNTARIDYNRSSFYDVSYVAYINYLKGVLDAIDALGIEYNIEYTPERTISMITFNNGIDSIVL